MLRNSAGILMFRDRGHGLEVLLAHPGGPYWARKDDHAWSIPKGEFDPVIEDAFEAAKRELGEETGATVTPPVAPLRLTPLKQPGGKLVHAFAVEQDFDTTAFRSSTFSLEWPPRSGHVRQFPEVDRVAWFSVEAARTKLLTGQLGFLDQLIRALTPADR